MNVQPWIASKVTNKLQGSHLAKHENMKGLKLDVPNIIECFPLYKSNFLLFSDIKYPQSNRSVPKKKNNTNPSFIQFYCTFISSNNIIIILCTY